jgi:hypothetical protein
VPSRYELAQPVIWVAFHTHGSKTTNDGASGVNFFMNKFRKMGFIKYNGGLQINTSLLSVVLHD